MSKKHQRPTAKELEHLKGKKRQAQKRRLRDYLRQHTVSRWMASIATGIPLHTICWIVGDLRKMDAVGVATTARCSISGRMVEFLTTDPDKFPKSNQLILPLT